MPNIQERIITERVGKRDMQAIIMAAGKGSRLGKLTENKPKSFAEIRGIKLLEYNIALLHANGIKDILLVTGYKNEMMEELAKGIQGVKCIYNPFYEMVNVLGSFYMAQEYLKGDFVYLHADTLCAPEIFANMLQNDGDIVLPVEFKLCDEEAMKVKTENEQLVEISKQIPCHEAEGEFIGIAKIREKVLPDLRTAAKKLMKEKQFMSYFEGSLQELADQKKYNIKTFSTEKYFWGEVDFPEDYVRVCELIPENLIKIAEKEWK